MKSKILALIAATLGIVLLSACGSNDVTKTRIESSLAPTFTNLYVQQAAILGHSGVNESSIDAHASCDKGGPKVADAGAGADWICMIDFADQDHAPQTGKFEVHAFADSCYTASGPSKLIGLQTITDTTGVDVTNPVFEFDGCFDPNQS